MRGVFLRRVISAFLFAVLLVLNFNLSSVRAETVSKKDINRDIAIVFDNSGSMYRDSSTKVKTKAWCQATYAMEVFAAMINQGDSLKIFPMNEIEIGPTKYTFDSPLVISKASDAFAIEQIHTPEPYKNDTHIESITKAHDSLIADKDKYDESWLVVLTDGDHFYEGGIPLDGEGSKSTAKTVEKLSSYLSQYNSDVRVLYLGIGDAVTPAIEGADSDSVVVVRDSEQVLVRLSEMCNKIFGRNQIIPENGQLSFDIPLNKLIVFAQGAGVDDVSISGLNQSTSPLKVHYSEMTDTGNADPNYKNADQDTTLQGVIATYENIKTGDYTLDQAASVTMYYEPDADIMVEMYGPDGERLSADTQEFLSGDYSIKYYLVDKEGKPIKADSKLLGTVQYEVT